MWRFAIAISIEALWEIIENSAFIIDRYRAATIALGYSGDTILNSLSDILICGLGFLLAFYLGFYSFVGVVYGDGSRPAPLGSR